ncbi:hypothetical protein M2451_003822 [Dysgonomonas sp. PFB1-18]|nr:hypothetical protein [Dysgonomonas sp. PF1-14]MDH6340827.1 hypothetical protein [Dysgonomonas sp. PF1-16]MDH6382481.1 hypothetical protein [Dysgonomonas sp. PFB1-18]MDH6399830.1 hypothetical protein [Dysgonomonas sp. PF1-23]
MRRINLSIKTIFTEQINVKFSKIKIYEMIILKTMCILIAIAISKLCFVQQK